MGLGELQDTATDLNPVAVREPHLFDQRSIDVCTVTAAAIGDDAAASGVAGDLGMLPRDFGIEQADLIPRAATDPDRVVSDLVAGSLILTLYDEKRRAAHSTVVAR